MSYLGKVIVVGGIGGNELYTPPTFLGFGPPLHVWLNSVSLLSGGWRLLALQADGITPVVPGVGPLAPGGLLQQYYSTLCLELTRRRWDVTGMLLDWRGTVQRDGERLAAVIRELASPEPVHLVAHSRGGLVCRQALRLLDLSGEATLVGRSIGLGVPHWGSWEGMGLIAGWNSSAHWLSLLLDRRSPSLIDILSINTINDVVKTWPAGYELLPSPFAPGITPEQAVWTYSPAAWDASGVPISIPWLSAARLHWGQLPFVPSVVDWVDVVGVGFATADQLLDREGMASTHGFAWEPSGDSTVPARWAVQPGRWKVTTPTSHAAMTYDGRVIEQIHRHLSVGINSNVVIDGPPL